MKKSLLLISAVLMISMPIQATENLPKEKYIIKTNSDHFNNSNYKKEHNTETEAMSELQRYSQEEFNGNIILNFEDKNYNKQGKSKEIKNELIIEESEILRYDKVGRLANSTNLKDLTLGRHSGMRCENQIPYFIWNSYHEVKFIFDNATDSTEKNKIKYIYLENITGANSLSGDWVGYKQIKKDEVGLTYFTTSYLENYRLYPTDFKKNHYGGINYRYYEFYGLCLVDMDKEENLMAIQKSVLSPAIEIEIVQEIDPEVSGSCEAKVGNPCDVFSGEKMQIENDYVSNSIKFSRYYNSYNDKKYDSTGYLGWSVSYSNKIRSVSNNDIEIPAYGSDQKATYFKKIEENNFVNKFEPNSEIKFIEEENEIYHRTKGNLYVYDMTNFKLKRAIENGNNLLFKYEHLENQELLTKIMADDGDYLNLEYNKVGEKHILVKVFNNLKTIEYNFKDINNDGENFNLTSVMYDSQSEKTYHYEISQYKSLLTGITDEKNIRYASWEYDTEGKAISSEHAGGYERVDIERLEYQNNVYNANGGKKSYYFNKKQGVGKLSGISTELSTNESYYKSFGYAGNQEQPYLITNNWYSNSNEDEIMMNGGDMVGFNEKVTYNVKNQLVSKKIVKDTWLMTGGNSQDTEVEQFYTYEESTEIGGGEQIKSITGTDVNVEYSYINRTDNNFTSIFSEEDFPNRDFYSKKIKSMKYTDVTNNSVPYSTNGNVKEVKFSYYDNQDLKAINGARTDINDITYFQYVDKGILEYSYSSECISGSDINGSLSVNLSAQSCRYVHFSNFTEYLNQPQTITDENGVATNITYDSKGRVINSRTITTDGEVSSSYIFDEVDNLEKIILPNGSWIKYYYNEARYLYKMENSIGETIEYDTDLEGNEIERRIKSASGTLVKQQNWVFDLGNRLKKTISGNLFETTYNYAPYNKMLDHTVDNIGNKNRVIFDGLDRVMKEVDALSGEVLRNYSNTENKEEVVDQRGNKTIYTKDGFGNVVRRESPDTGVTDMWYDEADNMVKQVLANGTTINYDYDVSNRLTDIRYPDSAYNVSFDYDTATNGKGQIALITYKHGTIAYDYTQLGQVDTQTNTINSESYVIDYDYTAWGALNAMTYPSGRKVTYALDTLDRVTSVSVDDQVIVENIDYLAFGGVKSYDYGNGMSFVADFDKDYLVRNVTHSNGTSDLFNETYGYEKMYQINTITDNVNPTKNQSFVYDAKSQLTNATGDYGTYDYTLDEVGNRTSKTFNMSDIENYNIDQLSNKLLSVDKDISTRTLNYNDNGNVIEDVGYDEVSKTLTYGDNNRLIDVNGFTYGYNPMQQRVIDNGKINNYDLNGQLISVNDGNNIIEYIYLGNAKIAMLVDDGIDLKTYYSHNNYMNMPRLFTDEYKNVVWSGDFTPFGELYNEYGSVNIVMRFAGQYENIESGYFYNYNRDYDASLGRYLQSDPIGLNGGINTYAYVGGNPINYLDPLGLKCSCANPDKLLSLLLDSDGKPRKDGTDWSIAGNSGSGLYLGGSGKNKCNRFVDHYIEKAGGNFPNISGNFFSRLLRKNPASTALIYAGNVEGWEYHVGNLQNKSTLNKLKVGDLLIAGEGVHIGIYIGNGRSISANGEFGARLGTKDISVDYDQGFAFRCTCNM